MQGLSRWFPKRIQPIFLQFSEIVADNRGSRLGLLGLLFVCKVAAKAPTVMIMAQNLGKGSLLVGGYGAAVYVGGGPLGAGSTLGTRQSRAAQWGLEIGRDRLWPY